VSCCNAAMGLQLSQRFRLPESGVSDVQQYNGRRPLIAERFEELLEENLDKPLRVAEICSALEIPERALRTHCIERLGVSPVRYQWLRRMCQARSALASANAANKTVTEIAMDHGFWELGRFSVATESSSVSHL
jgi:AraC-like DNA-binding protein